MALPKVTYFDFAGSRGEEVRLALTLAGMAFEDNRVDREAFLRMKSDLPFGSLPTFEIEGRGVFGQSNAILRLIGRKHGLHPEEAFEGARHDALMDAAEDLRQRINPTARIQDPAEKKAARLALAADYIPMWAACVERQLGKGPFVAGDKINVADLKLFMVHKWLSSGGVDDIPTDIFASCLKLTALAAAVKSYPAIVAWYAR